MPEPTSAGGGYSCQVCGMTYRSESELVQHGRDQHPNQPVTWGDPREGMTSAAATTTRTGTEPERKSEDNLQRRAEDAGDKIKAGAEALGRKISDPDRDLKREYEQKKAEDEAK